MNAATPSYQPFSSGSEYIDWCGLNCDRCIKGPPPDLQGPNEACEIENAFALASLCAGTLNDEVIGGIEAAQKLAKRLNWDGNSTLPARCPEFAPRAERSNSPPSP